MASSIVDEPECQDSGGPADRRARRRCSCARQPRSTELIAEAREHLAGGATSNWQIAQPQAVWMSHGAGSKVYDVDGTEYVDMHGGYGASIAGHAHPAIVEAVSDQVRRGTHFAQPTEDAIWIAGELARRFELPLWRFANSGTEATMDAVHLARAVTGRDLIIKVEGCYHGHHDSVQVSVLPEADEVGPRDASDRRCRATAASPPRSATWSSSCRSTTRTRWHGRWPSTAARWPAMIVEPVMMNAGIIPPDDGYLAAIRDLAARRGRAADLRRGQDRLHHRARAASPRCPAWCPTWSVWPRRWAAASRSPRSAAPTR